MKVIESVYSNEEEANSDLSRLIKLKDMEGIRLRFMEMYKER